MESVLGSPLGQQSIALLEHTLEERARAGETSGPSVASVWRALSEALAAERQHFRAMAARRRASRAYVGAADSATLDFAAGLDAVDALKQACVELRYGVVTEVDVIDLGVELVRDGGPFAGDEALMELACLDSRLDGECARAGFALDRALEVHAPGWRLEVNGHELARLVLDLAVQRFLEESAAAGSSARETESGVTSYGSVRPLADLVTAMHADLGSLPWLELFHVGGASGTVMSFDDHNPEEVDALREACSAYLADRSGAGDCDALKARERIGERAERERALQRAYEDFNRGREALRQGRSGAETALRAAVSAFERWLPGSRWTATAQNELALALKAKGRLQDAAALLREAHDYFITHHGEGDPDSATAMHNLGATLNQMGEFEAGGTLLERSLELQLQHQYTSMVDIANNYETLGENLHSRGRLSESRDLLEKALALREKGHYARVTAIADTCAHLSEVAAELGDHAAAEVYARRVLSVRSEALGHFHRDTADALNQLGVVLFSLGRLEDAEQQFRQALSRFEEQAGQNDPFAINARINLAEALLKRGGEHLYDAVAFAQDALNLCGRALEPDHSYTARALSTLGDAYRLLGRYGEAVPVLTRARDIHERRCGRDDLRTAYCVNTLGLVFKESGAMEEAERMLMQAEETFASRLGPLHPDSLTAKCNRAHVVFLRGNVAQAERLWTEVFQAGQNGEAAYRLGNSLLARGETAAAEVRFLAALDIYERQHGQACWLVGIVSEALGETHRKQGEAAEAERCFGRASSIYEQIYGGLHEDTDRALSRLIEMVSMRDRDLAIGMAYTALSDIEGNSREAVIAIARRAFQLGELLRGANRLSESAKIFGSILSLRSDALRFDSELAVSAALNVASVQASMHDDVGMLKTLQQALARCDEEPDADEGAAARICNVLGRELMRLGRMQDASIAAQRAWTFYRPVEQEAEAAASAFAVYWRTALAGRVPGRLGRPSDYWLLRVEFDPQSPGDELGTVVKWILRTSPSTSRFVASPAAPSRLCRTGPASIAYADSDRLGAFVEHGRSELVVRLDPAAGAEARLLQSDLVCALAQYPRLKWKHWTLHQIAGGEESVYAEGTDGAELVAIWR